MAQFSATAVGRVGSATLSRSSLWPLLAFLGLCLGVALFFVWTRLHVLHLEYDISGLEGRVRAARHQTAQLKLEAATLRRPEAVEQIAREEFGLAMPDPRQMIVVR